MQAPKHAVVSCLVKEVEETLDCYSDEYLLVGMSSCQVGTGFGAHVEVILAFRLREAEEVSNGLPAGRQRRSPMPVLSNGKK